TTTTDHPLPCTNKFKPRKSVPRKNPPISSLYYLDYNHRLAELGLEHEPTELRFNGQRFTFRKGRWVSHSRDMDNSSQSDLVKNMRERNRLLQEQNNILTLKMETLMDMLTETTANLWMFKCKKHHQEH
uniref:Chibby family member 3 n=1 Tax=Callorhinchus milii TaxID=7868 RepID=A0A4W3HEM4_CALMI